MCKRKSVKNKVYNFGRKTTKNRFMAINKEQNKIVKKKKVSKLDKMIRIVSSPYKGFPAKLNGIATRTCPMSSPMLPTSKCLTRV